MLFEPILTAAVLACSLLATNVHASSPFGRVGRNTRDPRSVAKRASPNVKHARSHDGFRFLSNQTKPYLVDHLPEVPFDLGELYSGSVPINKGNNSRNLFFVFQPTIGAPVDEITIWLNGGPGCSSLSGFFQENGRFLWQPGTYRPVENPYTWVNLTNMLWVDQPVGTGFATGKPVAVSQEETAEEFIKFFKNFQDIFGIRKFKIFVTGESYAGRYVPYISAAMLNQNNTDYYDLKGALLYDPCIGQYDYTQEEVITVPYVQQNANLFHFNASFMEELESRHQSCGYKDYFEKYFQFPPPGPQPPQTVDMNSKCDLFDLVTNDVYNSNPCFNIYATNDMCPIPWDVLGMPTALMYQPENTQAYFDRADVKRAMHAPLNVTWSQCSAENVFTAGDKGPQKEGDLSANPTDHVLPQVIEATNRVLIGNGDYDMIIITNGTLLAIQNMTWNGHLGFQTAPSEPINVDIPDLQYQDVFAGKNHMQGYDGPQGLAGIQHYERGLMWVETFQSGHMEPQNQPRVSYRHLEWLLGRTEKV